LAASAGDVPPPEDVRDLGFGSRVAERSRLRFLNRDGSFNVRRDGLPRLQSLNFYHAFLSISWSRFFAALVAAYVVTNLLFACGYLLCGPGALHGSTAASRMERFVEAFFFSVQTLATIGYGRLSPSGLAANTLVSVEALVGLLGVAFATGLTFGRFSRPNARILFSRRAVIAPYHGITGLMFRIVNARSNQLINVRVTLIYSRMVEGTGGPRRRFDPLALERPSVVFFPLHWTIVHPIDASSPLRGVGAGELERTEAEFLILLQGTDETFSQEVHTRTSYKADEVAVGARFKDMFSDGDGSGVAVDVRRLDDVEPA
jgi:inward rectifier potassium channel